MNSQYFSKIISQYHQPSDTWFVKSHEEFIDKFFRKGRFHKDVPESIVKDYELVERMICYSYYYYPLYDEALAKLTQVFESAVNLRAKEFGISLVKDDGSFKGLHLKLKELKKQTTQYTYDKLIWSKEIRNMFAHRNAGSFGGVTFNRVFYSVINYINFLFLDKNILENNEFILEKLKEKTKSMFSDYVEFVAKSETLIFSEIFPVSVSLNKNRPSSLWGVKLAHTINKNDDGNYCRERAYCIELSNIRISNDSIYAVAYKTGEKIIIKNTINNNYQQTDKTNPSEKDLMILNLIDEKNISDTVTDYRYHNWDNFIPYESIDSYQKD